LRSVHVIDIRSSQEISLSNPFDREITAVYVDEGLLMLASYANLMETKPANLFLDPTTKSFDRSVLSRSELDKRFSDVSRKYSLPGDLGSHNSEIYAFWHTKNSVSVDIFVKSLKGMRISIYSFKT